MRALKTDRPIPLRTPDRRIAERMARFSARSSGATAVEYSLIAGLIALAVVTSIYVLGDEVLTGYYDVLADAVGGH